MLRLLVLLVCVTFIAAQWGYGGILVSLTRDNVTLIGNPYGGYGGRPYGYGAYGGRPGGYGMYGGRGYGGPGGFGGMNPVQGAIQGAVMGAMFG